MKWIFSSPACKSILLIMLACACSAQTDPVAKPEIGILALNVNGQETKLSPNERLQLSPFMGSVDIKFGPLPRSGKQSSAPVRIRYKLEGVDAAWQEPTGPANVMRVSIGFLDQNDNEVMHKDFEARGQSPGWTGSFETSPLQHRREQVVVPVEASKIWVVISSAGAPSVVGAYFVGNLTVRVQNTAQSSVDELLHVAFNPSPQNPVGWLRDGPRANMAKIVAGGRGKSVKGLAVVDDSASGHAQWNTPKNQGPKVSPLDVLVLEWDEMFSIALATPTQVSYKDLRPGFYRFNLNRLSLMGVPTDEEVSLGFEVLSPFWKTTWFWASTLCATLGIALAIWRFQISRQLKVENSRLAQQQVLEAERFRIARDIHDDFGARVTQISLLSSAAQKKQGLNPEAAADFEEVSQMSRDLVGALYETVWAISPENDHLDSLATYLFQMVSQMCAQAVLKCRLHMPDLPHEVPVTSTVRHNLVMTIKEALHNIIKHAQATEVQITLKYENEVLAIEVKDNGKGFDLSSARHGRGLDNMARRMAVLGGRRTQDSRPGGGTSVRIELCLPSNAGAAQQGRSEGQNL